MSDYEKRLWYALLLSIVKKCRRKIRFVLWGCKYRLLLEGLLCLILGLL